MPTNLLSRPFKMPLLTQPNSSGLPNYYYLYGFTWSQGVTTLANGTLSFPLYNEVITAIANEYVALSILPTLGDTWFLFGQNFVSPDCSMNVMAIVINGPSTTPYIFPAMNLQIGSQYWAIGQCGSASTT